MVKPLNHQRFGFYSRCLRSAGPPVAASRAPAAVQRALQEAPDTRAASPRALEKKRHGLYLDGPWCHLLYMG